MNDLVKAPNITQLRKSHVNKWVALTPDYKKLLAVGKSLPSVLSKTQKFKDKVVMKVLPPLGYVPWSR